VVAALAVLAAVVAWAALYALILRDLPEIQSLRDYEPNLITRVLAHDGQEVAQIYRERRIVVPIEDMPEHLVRAFIAAEDDAFYEHEGLDYLGIARAAFANLRAGRVRQGGSTITQQVAKTFLLSSQRTYVRKIKDMVLAMRIEGSLNKNEILYLYLNQIYLGSGAYGVEAAAQTYFGKPVSELDLAESALIAGLVPAPSLYTPFRSLENALRRQRFVLGRMLDQEFVTEEEAAEAELQELVFYERKRPEIASAAAFFVEEVRRYLVEKYDEELVLTGGLSVRTSLDVDKQIAAAKAVRAGLRAHAERSGYRGPLERLEEVAFEEKLVELGENHDPENEREGTIVPALVLEVDDKAERIRLAFGPERETTLGLDDVEWARKPDPNLDGAYTKLSRVSEALEPGWLVELERTGEDASGAPTYGLYAEPEAEGALIAFDLETGAVEAMTGGYSFSRSQFNRAVQMKRQPGSAFKPLIYAAALERGYTPATIVHDTPIVYEDSETGLVWKPGNYSDKFYGPITMREALAHSRNIATIKILRDIGVPPVLQLARAVGIDEKLEPNLGLALGASEVTLAQLVRAYATFGANGRRIEPKFVLEVLDRDGNLLEADVPLLLSGEEEDGEVSLPGDLVTEIRAQVDRDDRGSLPPGYGVDPITAYLMTDLLRAVVEEGTGRRVRALGRPMAGKTGTTNDLHDAWFIGYSPQTVAGVWVGYDQARPLGRNEAGSRAASPIFIDYMREALANEPKRDFEVPTSGIVFARIDPKTGLVARSGDGVAVFQPFREGTAPADLAPEEINGTATHGRPTRLD
jgi:penicillin-binding protein 1A